MEERQALELRADNLGSELTKSKSAVAEMETMIQAHHAAEDELKAAAAAAQEAAASATECASAREAELKALQASNIAEVAAWQAKAEELKAVRVCVCVCVCVCRAWLAQRVRYHKCMQTCGKLPSIPLTHTCTW